MVTNLAANITLSVTGKYQDQKKPGRGVYPIPFEKAVSLTNGTGSGQATRAWAVKRTIAANSFQDIDFSSAIVDAFGNVIPLAKVKALIANAPATNDNEALIGAAGAGLWTLFGTNSSRLRVRPGGMMAVSAPDVAGYGVVSGSASTVRITNPGATGSVTIRLLVIGVAVADLPAATAIILPDEFLARWNPGVNLYNRGGVYSTDFSYVTLKPAVTKTYRVKSGGNDAGAGGVGTELASLSIALAKGDVDRVLIDTMAGDYIMWGSLGWNNAQPSRNVSVEVTGPGRAISVCTSNVGTAAPQTWVNTAGAVYKTTVTATNARSVIDLANRELDGFYQRLDEVGSTAAVASTPGTWFHDGTDLHVQAWNSRNLIGDALMAVCGQGNNMRVPSASRTVYVDGVDFVGGIPLNYTGAGAVDPLCVVLNSTFQGCHNQSGNGIFITGPGRFYIYRVGAGRNYRDQLNYHGNGFGDPKVFENECWTGLGGYIGTSDNASTSHENATILRLNGNYQMSLNRPIADILDTRVVMIGGRVGQARTVALAMECIAQQQTNKTWLDGVSIEAGGNAQLMIHVGATVYYRNMPAPTRAGTGEDAGTLLAWAA